MKIFAIDSSRKKKYPNLSPVQINIKIMENKFASKLIIESLLMISFGYLLPNNSFIY